MSAKYKSPSFLLPNELNTSANTANDTGVNSLYSMDFNGSSDYIISNDTLITGNESRSISVWAKSSVSLTTNDNQVPFSLGTGSAGNKTKFAIKIRGSQRVQIDAKSYNVDFTSSYPGANWGSIDLNDGQWHHYVVTYATDDLKLYVDGTFIAGSTNYNSLATQDGVIIGAWYRNGAFSDYFPGQIDEVSVFNRVLNTTEIAALYDGSGSNIRPSNLMATDLNPVAYYPLGEQAQMQGYLGNEASSEWQFPNGVLQDYVMDFDGGDNINITDAPSPNGTQTLSMWINTSTSGNNGGLFTIAPNGATSDYWSVALWNSNIHCSTANTGSKQSTTNVADGNWHNIIFVKSSSVCTHMYIDGDLQTLSNGSWQGPINTPQAKIGSGNYSNTEYYFTGKISNVVLWTSDQSANKDNIYNNGSPQTSYTVAPQNWWKLNADSVYTPSAPNYTTALNFNSTKADLDYVQFGNTSLSLPASLSIWLKPLGVPSTGYGMPYSDSSGQIYWATGAGGMKYEVTLAGAARVDSTVTLTADIGGWQHLVITFTSTATKIYLNGELNASGSGGTGANFGQDINIGRLKQYGTNILYGFDGSISNFAIFNSELSASQVSTLFNFGTPETNISLSPIHNWKLNNLTTGLNDTGSLASNNGTAGSVNGTGPVQESTSVAVVPSWKIPSALTIQTPNYTKAIDFPRSNSDYINTSFNPSTVIGDNASFTISSWIRPTDVNNFMIFMGSYSSSNNRRFF